MVAVVLWIHAALFALATNSKVAAVDAHKQRHLRSLSRHRRNSVANGTDEGAPRAGIGVAAEGGGVSSTDTTLTKKELLMCAHPDDHGHLEKYGVLFGDCVPRSSIYMTGSVLGFSSTGVCDINAYRVMKLLRNVAMGNCLEHIPFIVYVEDEHEGCIVYTRSADFDLNRDSFDHTFIPDSKIQMISIFDLKTKQVRPRTKEIYGYHAAAALYDRNEGSAQIYDLDTGKSLWGSSWEKWVDASFPGREKDCLSFKTYVPACSLDGVSFGFGEATKGSEIGRHDVIAAAILEAVEGAAGGRPTITFPRAKLLDKGGAKVPDEMFRKDETVLRSLGSAPISQGLPALEKMFATYHPEGC